MVEEIVVSITFISEGEIPSPEHLTMLVFDQMSGVLDDNGLQIISVQAHEQESR